MGCALQPSLGDRNIISLSVPVTGTWESRQEWPAPLPVRDRNSGSGGHLAAGPAGGRPRAGTGCHAGTRPTGLSAPGNTIHHPKMRSESRFPSRGGTSFHPATEDTDGPIFKVWLAPEFPGGTQGNRLWRAWGHVCPAPGSQACVIESKINKPHLSFSRVLLPRALLSPAG